MVSSMDVWEYFEKTDCLWTYLLDRLHVCYGILGLLMIDTESHGNPVPTCKPHIIISLSQAVSPPHYDKVISFIQNYTNKSQH